MIGPTRASLTVRGRRFVLLMLAGLLALGPTAHASDESSTPAADGDDPKPGPAASLTELEGVLAPAPPVDTVAEIPRRLRKQYRSSARRCPGLPWTVVAGIGKVETDHGRIQFPTPDGAVGPMQLRPELWADYGVDADGDGRADRRDAADAVAAVADVLCAHWRGEPDRLAAAIRGLHPAWWYADLVLRHAARYAGPAGLSGVESRPQRAEIPRKMRRLYRKAARSCDGLRWTVLAGVGKALTDHGRRHVDEAGRRVGPMQFAPRAWDRYGIDADGDGDGQADAAAAADAVQGAAAFFCDRGGDHPATVALAVAEFGGDPRFAELALGYASQYALIDPARPPGYVACPVGDPHQFTNTWGAARSGGRSHEGVDIFAPYGAPNYAYRAGTVRLSTSPLGGLGLWIIADDGDAYYYAHLSGYAPGITNDVRVEAGTLVGYVGTTGNARFTPPHTHWEVHPGGGAAVDPTPYAEAACR